jgi:hypothetical protein
MRASVLLSCLVLSVFAFVSAGSMAAAAPDGACPRLSGPPAYGSPVVGEIAWRDGGVFRVTRVPGEAPWLLHPRLGPDGTWELTRLEVESPDQVGARPLASMPHRAAGDEVLEVLAGDPTGDGRPDFLLYWDLDDGAYAIDLLTSGTGGYAVEADALPLHGASFFGGTFGDFDGDLADELAWRPGAQTNQIRLDRYQPGAGFSTVLGKQLLLPRSLLAMDVDGDGIEDLVHVDSHYDTGWLFAHLGHPERPLDITEAQRLRYKPISVARRSEGNAGPAEVVVLQTQLGPNHLPRVRMTALARLGPSAWIPSWSELLPADHNLAPQVWDMDRDGHDDFFFRLGSYYQSRDGFQILRYREGAPYQPMHRSKGRVRLLDVLPVDGDELPDGLVLAGHGTLGRFEGTAPLRFDEGRTIWRFDIDTRRHVGYGDLNEDGLEDVIALVDQGELFWWRSLGQGEYESIPIPPPPGRPGPLWVADFDADGHEDVAIQSHLSDFEQYVLFVGWGDGSGIPASWWPVRQGDRLTEHVFADLDRDGDIDLLARELRGGDWREGSDFRAFLNQGRTFRPSDGAFIPPFDKGGGVINLASADVNQDGLMDALHYANDPDDRWAGRVVWRPNLGEGRFGEARDLLERRLRRFPRFVPTDLDRDEDVDLVVIDDCHGQGTSVRVLGNDDGAYRPFWSGPQTNDCPRVELVDVDGDGLLDLHEQATVAPSFRLWVADGTGGFDPVGDGDGYFVGERTGSGGDLANVWGGPGPDHVQVSDWSVQPSSVISVPQRTGRLDRDVAPPEVSLRLVPEVDTFGETDTFAGAWRVSAPAVDECTPTEVTRAFARTPELTTAVPARFAPGASYEVRVYESLESAEREVVLRGPSEAVARDLFAAMLERGGFELEPNAFLEIQTHDDWGRPPQDVGDGDLVTLAAARLTHVWRLDGTELTAVRVHRPGADVTFEVAAVDGTGKRATATGTYRQERQRYCDEHPGQATVCD